MRIGGFQRFSLLDYPGKIAAIVFTQGCNFRCGYCHNRQLACPELFEAPIDETIVLEFLEMRRGKLQGVVVTGGEPTIQKDLLEFLVKLKRLGYAVKLDTNGSNPDVLESAIHLQLIDFVAMDIKTSFDHYQKASGIKTNVEALKKSIDLILQSGLRHQFRTTLVRSHCSAEDLQSIQPLIGKTRHYVLQSFMPLSTIINPHLLTQKQYSHEEVQELRLKFQRGV